MRLFFLPAIAVFALCAQEMPDGSVLMKERDAAQKRLHSLEFKASMTTEITRQGQTMKVGADVVNAMVNPGKMRIETTVQGVKMLTISDGQMTYIFNGLTKQFAVRNAAMGPAAMLSAMGVNSLPDMAKVKIAEKTVGSETIDVGGQKHDCWIVENRAGEFSITDPAPMTVKEAVLRYWLDKKSKLDVQMTMVMKIAGPAGDMEMAQKVTKTGLKIDEDLPDSEFKFTPPDGAQLVDNVMGAGVPSTDLAGKDAPAFEVKTLDGKAYSLASLKGKPVLLDFWASWCGPCRAAMPDVETVAKQYKDQGLVVIGVNTGEDRDVVEGFLKKSPLGYPAVLSGDSGILEAYSVSSFPTFVVIGKDGKVAAYQVGYRDLATLRSLVAKAVQ
ncbi:MAG TPA: redoxin family protein [Candidatus Limnocylindrales bacterium]|nr:redoxin family protein [Candidatus Limnocylindrales bacterium]